MGSVIVPPTRWLSLVMLAALVAPVAVSQDSTADVAPLLVRGRVVGPHGEGVADCSVLAAGAGRGPAATGRTDAHGAYELHVTLGPRDPRQLTVYARPDVATHLAYGRAPVDLGDEPVDVSVQVPAGRPVQILVHDPGGRPAVGAYVLVERGLAAPPFTEIGVTDERGWLAFVLPDEPFESKDVRLRVATPEAAHRITVPPTAELLEVRLEPRAWVELRVEPDASRLIAETSEALWLEARDVEIPRQRAWVRLDASPVRLPSAATAHRPHDAPFVGRIYRVSLRGPGGEYVLDAGWHAEPGPRTFTVTRAQVASISGMHG